VTGRRGKRRKQIPHDLKETTGYWQQKEGAIDLTLWRTRFGRSYGPVVRQTTGYMNKCRCKYANRLRSIS